ncbi:MAG: acyltransferase family protein [Vicinamibacterales bacterium]
MPKSGGVTTDGSGRWHGLDALRAVALMSGVLLHALLAFIAKPGEWAVGRAEAQPFLSWLYIYLHAFRLEVFFLLAGFFGALIVAKRGVRAYAKDRVVRILLVFVVALYPIKAMVDALWITGGTLTGWMHLPPEYLAWPLWRQVLQSLVAERWQWPAINLAHLWFLYVLSYIVALFLIARALARRWPPPAALSDRLSAGLRVAAGNGAWPVVAALVLTPVIAGMHSPVIDTPDMSFAWNVPVSLLDGL